MTWAKRRAIVIIILAVFFVVLVIVASKPTALRLPSNGVLVMDLMGQIDEQRAPDIFSAFSGTTVPVLHDYVDAIDSAANDSRITGLVVRIAPLQTGWGKLEEIRAHLLRFHKSGKPSICYLGYDGIGNPEYYLASACEQIWLVPTAPVSIRGMMAEALFLRGTLDKLKVVPEFYHIAEYKTAGNMFTEKKFTPAHKEEVEGLLHSIYEQYLSDTSKARGMSPRAVRSAPEPRAVFLEGRGGEEDRGSPGILGPAAELFPQAGPGVESDFAESLSSLHQERRTQRDRGGARDGLDRFGRFRHHAGRRVRDGRRFGGV